LGSRPLTDKTPAIARADALDRKVPRALADVISRAVAIDPAQRFGSASELRESLERVQRQVATPWWQALVGTGLPAVGRVIGGVSLLVGLCIALGYISSTTFNFALGRLGWADDKPWNWLVWGARSLVSDTIVVVCLAAVFGLFVVLRNVLLPMSTSLRRWDQTLRTYLGRLAESSPGHVPILASWIILVLATILAVTWWTFSPYLDAMLSPMPGASDGQFALLGPDHLNSRYWLNLLLVVIAVAAIAAAVWIGRLRTASAPSSHRSLAVASWGIASLAIISSQIPNHFDIEEALMPRIEWNGQKCYVLGKRDTSTMLCCPARQKNDRHPVVPSQDIHLKESDVGYVYENFRR
jgi:hypothetical protein